MNATATVPLAVVALVIAEAAAEAAMVMLMAALLVAPPEVTETLPVNVPAVVGVPVIWPVEALITRPPGSPVAPKVRGDAALEVT